MEVVNGGDGSRVPAHGVRGGGDGSRMRMWRRRVDGSLEELDTFHRITLADGETLVGNSCSGGGYGPAVERDPALVAKDVVDSLITVERAHEVYGVICDGAGTIDAAATAARRRQMVQSLH